ncbi:hypothetical protein REPUB_Repub20aG0017500 [Reevesia pubescens]
MKGLEEWLVEVEPTIPMFPSLKELEIVDCEKLSRVPMMSRFCSLEVLCIKRCNELSWTEEEDGVFPSSLKVLRIEVCPNLRCIPSIEDGDISTLQKLLVDRCEKLSKIGEELLALSTSLRVILSMAEPWTLILDDPLANSFIAPATDDIKDYHQLIFEEYERSREQNEELGLNDIHTSSADAAYNSTDETSKEKTEA